MARSRAAAGTALTRTREPRRDAADAERKGVPAGGKVGQD
jgi:hypothetical protein